MMLAEVRVVEVESGTITWQRDYSYAISDEDLTTDALMANGSILFKHYTTCLTQWLAENITRALRGKPEQDDWQCQEIED